jgi:hypothetical protein
VSQAPVVAETDWKACSTKTAIGRAHDCLEETWEMCETAIAALNAVRISPAEVTGL